MRLIDGAGEFTSPGDATNHYVEQFRAPDLSVGTYSIAVGGKDDQTPHTEDEIYVVSSGRARLVAGQPGAETSVDVRPGSVAYVPAGEPHRFVDITDDLAILVFFAPPYRSRAQY
jgi:mannose-6-phosphate isomerase-like protein (cupin superfamily)